MVKYDGIVLGVIHSLNNEPMNKVAEGFFNKSISYMKRLKPGEVVALEEGEFFRKLADEAKKMNLTETCIRAYTSNLFKKGLPLVKMKINNKVSVISIKSDFKTLNLKEKLLALYYEKDPYQTTLFDLS